MNKFLLLFVTSMLSISVAHAQDYYGPTNITKANLEQSAIYGPAQLKQVKADSLTVTGTLQFNDLEVTQNAEFTGSVKDSENGRFSHLTITGPFEAKQITANSLTVAGPVKIDNLVVQGDTDIVSSTGSEKKPPAKFNGHGGSY